MRIEIIVYFSNDMNKRFMQSVERYKSYLFDVKEIEKICSENRTQIAELLEKINQFEILMPKLQQLQSEKNEKFENLLSDDEQLTKKNLQFSLQKISHFHNEMFKTIKQNNIKFSFNNYKKQIEQVQHVITEQNNIQTMSINNIIENYKKSLQNIEKSSESFEKQIKTTRPMQDNLKIIMDVEKQFKLIAKEIETNVETAIHSMIGLSQLNNQLSTNIGPQIDWCMNKVSALKEKEILKYPSNGKHISK